MTTYKTTLFGVKETTKIIAESLHKQGVTIDLIVSIAPALAKTTDIVDYVDLASTANAIGADYYCVPDYSMRTLPDDFFAKNTFQLGLVYGWQRLIPPAIMAKFSRGLFGFHASPDKLPKGRGRSPLNWGIILGKKILFNHCFRYTELADAGDIYSITPFAINAHDTILTVLYKSLYIAKVEFKRLIDDLNQGTLHLVPQHGESYSFPKRTPQDGLLDFSVMTTQEIINLIRGVTKPFAGAFSFVAGKTQIIIWQAWPFDDLLDFSHYQPGEVLDCLYNKPIIKTIDGSIIIHDYQGVILQVTDRLQRDNC